MYMDNMQILQGAFADFVIHTGFWNRPPEDTIEGIYYIYISYI